MIVTLRSILLLLAALLCSRSAVNAAGPPTATPPPWIKEHSPDIDLNHDYALTWDEFLAEVNKTFLGYDKDQDGQLSLSEYGVEGHQSVMAGYVTFHAKDIDANGDTIITSTELLTHARGLFDAFDANADGKITAIEFAAVQAANVSLEKGPPGSPLRLRLGVHPESGTVYKVQQSTNLALWKPIMSLAPTNQAQIEFLITNSVARAFYRAIVQDVPFVTQGRATNNVVTLGNYPGGRMTKSGTIMSSNGIVWTVPAATLFATGPKATDLYNPVTGVTPPNISAVNLDAVPITEVDPDGQVITGFLYADNYFELYVNGKLVAIDPIPYTPFNSCVVRFRAKAPITYAVRLVDWEENLGIGSEDNKGSAFFSGDGGFIASFSDGTMTGPQWKAQTYYIAPLVDPSSVVERLDGTRDSSSSPSQAPSNASSYAIHYLLPENWYAKTFIDGGWPAATTYTEAQIGVDNKPEYMNFRSQFTGQGAQFIWSSNIFLDNEVLVRYTTP